MKALKPLLVKPLDFQPLIWLGTGIGGALLLSGTGYGIYRIGSSIHLSGQRKEETMNSWESLITRHSNVLIEYSSYETDIWKALKYPALHDVEVEETSRFLKMMRHADAIEKTLSKSDGKYGSKELYANYESSVIDLEEAFLLAKNKAYRVRESNLSDAEQKDIRTAMNLLKHAEDEANSKESRQTYYEQLRKVIDRLNQSHGSPIVPQQALEVVAGHARLLLTDGSSVDNDTLMGEMLLNSVDSDNKINSIV